MSSNKAGRAAKQQKAENARVTAENTRNVQDQEYNIAVQNENQRRLNYKSTRKSELQQAGLDAQAEETEYRAQAIKDSGKVLTDWEMQEKIRLLQAKTGQNQVQADQMTITNEKLQESQSLLDKGADYWDARRKTAYDKAYQEADQGYEDFERKAVINKKYTDGYGDSIRAKPSATSRSRGQSYQNTRDTDYIPKNYNWFSDRSKGK